MKIKKKLKRNRTKGFTLLEILIVVLIIGIIVALVVPNFVGRSDQAKVSLTKTQISKIDEALQYYHLDNSHYPSTDQGLAALVERPSGFPEPLNWGPQPYMKKVPVDLWGNEYVYINDGNEFEVYSLGSDGEEGGDGMAEDISSNDI